MSSTSIPFASGRGLARSLGTFALAAAGVVLAATRPEPPSDLLVEGRALRFAGRLQPRRYRDHPARFHGHHAITYRGGSMAGKALITTGVPDRMIAEALAALGVRSGGGIPAAAWGSKDDADASEPDLRASGDSLEVHVRRPGGDWVPLETLLLDQGRPAALDLRFADNREWIDLYGSGCVVCLSSCPGSKIANRGYTIRENDQGPMDFTPAPAYQAALDVEVRIRER